jgi:hypothetical protein
MTNDHSIGFDQSAFGSAQISPQQTFGSNPGGVSPPAQDGHGGMFSQAATLSPQRTGTNPFAKNRPLTGSAQVVTNVTGSTNPFRQSAFVNQQTGTGWQHSNQGTLSGFDANNVETTPIFPRPGHG